MTKHCNILVVDDDKDTADSLAMLLHAEGRETRAAYSSQHVERITTDFAPDVALVDLFLPWKSGLVLGRALKLRFPRCILVAITGYDYDEYKVKAKEMGFDHFLVKPADPNVLNGIIEQALPAAV